MPKEVKSFRIGPPCDEVAPSQVLSDQDRVEGRLKEADLGVRRPVIIVIVVIIIIVVIIVIIDSKRPTSWTTKADWINDRRTSASRRTLCFS